MSEIIKEGWNKYLLQLQVHPLRTKAITSGVLIGSSDIIAQKITGVKKLQFRRVLLLMLYGLLYSGPFGHFFHKLMDMIFRGKKGNKTVAKKVLLEQLTSSPWNNILFMMYYGLVVEGRPWGSVKSKVGKDYPSVQLTAWKFWPVVGWINYQYMPLQFRVLFHSFVASCCERLATSERRLATSVERLAMTEQRIATSNPTTKACELRRKGLRPPAKRLATSGYH